VRAVAHPSYCATHLNNPPQHRSDHLQPRPKPTDWAPSPFGVPGQVVRVGEYADIVYARVIVNLENNCRRGGLSCWKDEAAAAGQSVKDGSLLERRGWVSIGDKDFQMATQASTTQALLSNKGRSGWLSYVVVAPK
jgi:hypothetical protein